MIKVNFSTIAIAFFAIIQVVNIIAKLSWAEDMSIWATLAPTFAGLFSYFVLFKWFCWVVNNFMNVQ